MTTIKEVTVPDIGQFSNVEIIEIAINVGSEIKAEDTLITLETEKASMDVPSPVSGIVKELKVKLGDKISQGSVIALVETSDADKKDEKTEKPEKPEKTESSEIEKEEKEEKEEKVEKVEKTEAPKPLTSEISHDYSNVHAGPATRQLARELGVDLTRVEGSGRKGRIVTKDVQTFVKSVMQTADNSQSGFAIEKGPEVDFSLFGEIEVKALSRIKKWTGKNLHRNWVTIPHITQFDEADITELEIFRQENKQAAEDNGIKLTPLSFILKAVVSALKNYPQFNASLASNGTDLILKKYFHIGVAVDTPNGLMVPVIKNVDSKGLFDLARELAELSGRAKLSKLKAEEMQGSCFTISSLGSIGGTAFTPIINAPDVAILGISKVQVKPVFLENQFVPRKMLPLSLSYDHRVIDGVEGAKFTAFIASQLQDIRKLLL